MTVDWTAVLLAAPASLPLVFTAINIATWTRGEAVGARDAKLSVLVPARNEEASIERLIRSIYRSSQPVLEVVVYDDQSTDGTPAILKRLQGEFGSLRVVRGNGLPEGWVGKPHACHRLAGAAKGDVFLFVDADVELEPHGLSRLLSLLARAAVVTAVPQQVTETWSERVMLPLLLLTYTSWLPLALVGVSRDPRVVAANGQLMMIRRSDYVDLDGFAAVRHEIVDDVAFCRHAKLRGKRVVFADGARMARCRMYTSLDEIWSGFSKNLYEGIGGSLVALLVVVALYLTAFVLPYVALVAGAATGEASWLIGGGIGVALNLATRVALAVRYRHSFGSVLAHPVAVLGLLAIALNSYRWSAKGKLQWAGRVYGSRNKRLGAA
ncbi:MAG: glycosyltransferase family A protein [Myxococcota bacterium]